MSKRLNGSAGTGKKINRNWAEFRYQIQEDNYEKNGQIRYSWSFNEQYGYITIELNNGIISESSLMNTDPSSPYCFKKTLGLYNDRSLVSVFERMLTESGIRNR